MHASRSQHPDTLAPGQRIGPFVLLAPLGSGGSGRIWAVARVGQLGFSKRMVLKVMRHDKLFSERARERFDREACLGAQLSHPNVRAVHDLGSHEGRPFMALSWVDASLEELLEHSPGHALDADVVCWIGMQCCSALTAAHEFVDRAGAARPIVHRDVSPGNILLTLDGHALLADLTAPAAEASPRPEAAARFFGSLGYAAPEALLQQKIDARADLFSLGAVLFEALAGTSAFEGDDERSVMFQILEGPPLDLARRAKGVPADLAGVVQRCLERRPDNRFQSARELRAALACCSRQRSNFSLERHTASAVSAVLGARIRAREEALHQAYQSIAPSPFEHTDTLPIRGAASQEAQGQPALEAPVSDPTRDLSHSGAGVALSRRRERRRRGTLWAAGALLLSLGVYTSLAIQRGESRGPAPRPPAGAGVPGSDATPVQRPAESQKEPDSPTTPLKAEDSGEPKATPNASPPAGEAVPVEPASIARDETRSPAKPSTRPSSALPRSGPVPARTRAVDGSQVARQGDSSAANRSGVRGELGSPAEATPLSDAERGPEAARGAPQRIRESPYMRNKRTPAADADPARPR